MNATPQVQSVPASGACSVRDGGTAQVEDERCTSTSAGGAAQVEVAGIELGSQVELAGIERQLGDGRADGEQRWRRWQGEETKSNGLIA